MAQAVGSRRGCIVSNEAQVHEWIIDGVKAVLDLSNAFMEAHQEDLLRRALAARECVKIVIPDPSIKTFRVCSMVLQENDRKDRVWFVYCDEEQPDLVHRVMRPIANRSNQSYP